VDAWEASPDTRPLSEVDPLDLAGAIDPTTQQTARWHYGPNAPAHKTKGADGVIPTTKKKG